MTESDWASAADPAPLLAFAAPQLSNRKLRLAVVGCLWRRPTLFAAPDVMSALDLATQAAVHTMHLTPLAAASADRAAEEPGPAWQAHAAQAAACAARMDQVLRMPIAFYPGTQQLELTAVAAVWWAARAWAEYEVAHAGGGQLRLKAVEAAERAAQAHVVRCVIGNPFAYTVADPGWLTSSVRGVARAIDAADDFASLPVLADALEEAGCDDPAVLHHLRHHRDHARGCWVLDLLLGRA